ncbi:NAD(P)-binding protein [Xylaria grammica]|nr:NAD(P)-binding protein [Xylaria grammica]
MHPNKTLIYKEYTPHLPVPDKHLVVESRPFDPEADPPPGGITAKNQYLSFDPYMRGQMRLPDDTATYSMSWVEGEPAVVTTLSTVLKSNHPAFRPGDLVSAMADAGEFAAVPAHLATITRAHPPPPPGVTITPTTLVGALGIAGLAAYVSFFEFVPEPRANKTLFVSAASGGVGQLVGQIAKMHRMKELGFDAAWNYKAEKTSDALARLASEGLDVYYDNVGGEQLESALLAMKDFGTIVESGMASQYNKPIEDNYGVKTLMQIVFKRLKVVGFICSDQHLLDKYLASFGVDMGRWLAEGKIKTREEMMIGMDNAPEAMIRTWQGDKFGKMVLKIDEE